MVQNRPSDDLECDWRSTMCAPLMVLDKDQMTNLRKHSILASIGTSLIWFYWKSKILDGLDENNVKFWKISRMSVKHQPWGAEKNGKITNKLRKFRRPRLYGLLKLIWWAGVGHQEDETAAEWRKGWKLETDPWSVFSAWERLIPLYSYCLIAL